MEAAEHDWSWAHETDATHPKMVDPSRVVAVLLVHNAEPWLARTLSALARLDCLPPVVAVDLGSSDASRTMLDQALADGQLAAVHEGGATEPPGRALARIEPGLEDNVQWLWFLHDDVEPRPDALTELLRGATDEAGEPAVDILLPKLLEPRRRNHPDRIAELGQSISPGGRRVLAPAAGDLDQSQVAASSVLGGSTAGMLIARQAWRRLDGTSPQLPLYRDGVDLGWRANQAGLSVRTCPQAAVHHRRAGRSGQRESVIASHPDSLDRLLGLRLVAAQSNHGWLTGLRLMLGCLLAAVGHLLGKAPSAAADDLRAARAFLSSGDQTSGLRERVSSTPEPAGTRHLRPSAGARWRMRFDALAGWVADVVLPERDAETTLDELTTDEVQHRGRRRFPVLAVGLTALVLTALVAGRRLFGFGVLEGAALAPSPAELTDAWDAWLRTPLGASGFQSAGWLGAGAVGSWFTLGRPAWFALLSQLFCVPLAAVTALVLWRRFVPQAPRWVQGLLALAWAMVLPAIGAVASGRPSSLFVAVLLPLAAAALHTWWCQTSEGAQAWRAPAAFAGWTTLVTLALPALWLPAALAATVTAIRRPPRAALVLLVAPLVALAGWLPRLVREPARLLNGSDPHRWAEAPQLPWWALALLVLLLAAAAVLGLLMDDRGVDDWWLVALGIGSAATAWAVTRLPLRLDGLGVRADPDGWLLVACLVLLVIAARGLASGLPRVVHIVAGLLIVASLVSAVWWLSAPDGGVQRSRGSLGAHVDAVQRSSRQTRALLVEVAPGGARWNVVAADAPIWGTAEGLPVPDGAQRAAAESLVTAMVTGQPSDEVAPLARDLAIGHLHLTGADPEVVASFSDSAGLGPAETRDGGTTWTVTGLVTREATDDWQGPRHWWPVGVQVLVLGLLVELAAPVSSRTAGPRRARSAAGGRR
ncbi:hypothetical protein ACTQ49_01970 [Luteococcus sp. Sow4_B9]|uniref:glycosyltransferase family 2 protein n=1 Tax=Luteococcus sp. Sow4_B9 TaxID=3438792 RepID=UPI003F9726DB